MFPIPKEIKHILKINKLKIEMIDGDGGSIVPFFRIIKIGKNQTDEKKLFTLLHEIGHYIDISKRGYAEVFKGRNLYNAGYLSFDVCQAVYETEVIAWNEAIDLIKSTGIKLNMSAFYTLMRISLKTYEHSDFFDRSVA